MQVYVMEFKKTHLFIAQNNIILPELTHNLKHETNFKTDTRIIHIVLHPNDIFCVYLLITK